MKFEIACVDWICPDQQQCLPELYQHQHRCRLSYSTACPIPGFSATCRWPSHPPSTSSENQHRGSGSATARSACPEIREAQGQCHCLASVGSPHFGFWGAVVDAAGPTASSFVFERRRHSQLQSAGHFECGCYVCQWVRLEGFARV